MKWWNSKRSIKCETFNFWNDIHSIEDHTLFIRNSCSEYMLFMISFVVYISFVFVDDAKHKLKINQFITISSELYIIRVCFDQLWASWLCETHMWNILLLKYISIEQHSSVASEQHILFLFENHEFDLRCGCVMLSNISHNSRHHSQFRLSDSFLSLAA